MRTRLENTSAGSNKFWAVEVSGKECKVSYGKIGKDGREIQKSFATPEAAAAYADKKVKEKLRGGYEVRDGFDGGSSSTPALPASATAPTPGGVLNARLNAALGTPTPVALGGHYKGVANQLKLVRAGFDKLQTALTKFKAPTSGLLADLDGRNPSRSKDAVLKVIKDKRAAFEALATGPAKAIFADPNSEASAPRAVLDAAHKEIASLAAWAGALEVPMAFSFKFVDHGLEASLKRMASALPNLDTVSAPKLDAAAFAKLPRRERESQLNSMDRHGFELDWPSDDVTDIDAFVKGLVKQAGIDEMLEYVVGLAEDDSDAYDDVEIGEPSINEVYAIKRDGEIFAYQVETHINRAPQDMDNIGVHFVMPDGEIFGDHPR